MSELYESRPKGLKRRVGTIDMRPTPTAYAKRLLAILESGNEQSKEWARRDFIRLVEAASHRNRHTN